MIRWMRPLLLTVGILALSTAMVLAASTTLSIWVDAGTSEFDFAGTEVKVESTAPIIVHLSQENGAVVGRVDLAPGTSTARVKITLAAKPIDGP